LPVGDVRRCEAKIIANRRRNIEPGTAVQVRFGPFVLEDVLEMVGAKRPAVFPLGVGGLVAFADGDPTVFADGPPGSL
jgi:hypothetical protein